MVIDSGKTFISQLELSVSVYLLTFISLSLLELFFFRALLPPQLVDEQQCLPPLLFCGFTTLFIVFLRNLPFPLWLKTILLESDEVSRWCFSPGVNTT